MKLAPVVLLLLAAAAVAEDEPTVLGRLMSDSAAERAWGAHLAGKTGETKAVPRLVDLIGTIPDRKDDEGRLVQRAAFDALIRLKAPVRVKDLEPHLRGYFATQALILLTRSPDLTPEFLLRRFDRHGKELLGAHGIALGNLLCARKAPGFASRLLRHVRLLTLTVCIVDEGFAGSGGNQRIGGSHGDGRLDIPKGFPPAAIYLLTDRERENSVLLVDGPRPIRWRRIERKGPRVGFGSNWSRVDYEVLTREWLAVMSGIPLKDLGIPRRSSTSLIWTTDDGYVKHVSARRDGILAAFWKLVAALIDKDALALGEARLLAPKVTVEVADKRKQPIDREFPKLPAPPKRPRLPGELPESR